MWSFSLNGKFNIQDAYTLALKTFPMSQRVNEDNAANFKWIWKTYCHPRRRFFLWKLIMHGIPLKATLKARGISLCPICPLCGQDYENSHHLFKYCPMTMLAWKEINSISKITEHADFDMWLKINLTSTDCSFLNIPHGSLFAYMLWNIWLSRNLKIFQHAPFHPISVFTDTKKHASEWFFLAESNISITRPHNTLLVCWQPPNHGWFKCNTDGSCIESSNGIGNIFAGGVIRDCFGNWVKGFACPLGRGSSLLAELWAIYIGIQVALEHGCLSLEIESDCL